MEPILALLTGIAILAVVAAIVFRYWIAKKRLDDNSFRFSGTSATYLSRPSRASRLSSPSRGHSLPTRCEDGLHLLRPLIDRLIPCETRLLTE